MLKTLSGLNSKIKRLTPKVASQKARVIASVYRDVWIATYANSTYDISRDDLINHFSDHEQLFENWSEKLADENRAVWIAENSEGKMIGFCVSRKDKDFNELEYIYILPKYQSSGIGKKFMNVAINWMTDSKPIILYGAAYNNKAVRFYEKFGFELSDEKIEPKILKNGKALPTMKMVRKNIK